MVPFRVWLLCVAVTVGAFASEEAVPVVACSDDRTEKKRLQEAVRDDGGGPALEHDTAPQKEEPRGHEQKHEHGEGACCAGCASGHGRCSSLEVEASREVEETETQRAPLVTQETADSCADYSLTDKGETDADNKMATRDNQAATTEAPDQRERPLTPDQAKEESNGAKTAKDHDLDAKSEDDDDDLDKKSRAEEIVDEMERADGAAPPMQFRACNMLCSVPPGLLALDLGSAKAEKSVLSKRPGFYETPVLNTWIGAAFGTAFLNVDDFCDRFPLKACTPLGRDHWAWSKGTYAKYFLDGDVWGFEEELQEELLRNESYPVLTDAWASASIDSPYPLPMPGVLYECESPANTFDDTSDLPIEEGSVRKTIVQFQLDPRRKTIVLEKAVASDRIRAIIEQPGSRFADIFRHFRERPREKELIKDARLHEEWVQRERLAVEKMFETTDRLSDKPLRELFQGAVAANDGTVFDYFRHTDFCQKHCNPLKRQDETAMFAHPDPQKRKERFKEYVRTHSLDLALPHGETFGLKDFCVDKYQRMARQSVFDPYNQLMMMMPLFMR